MSNKETLLLLLCIPLFFLNACSMPSMPTLPSMPSLFEDDAKEMTVEDEGRSVKGEKFEVSSVLKGKHSVKEDYIHPLTISRKAIEEVLTNLSYQKREYRQLIKTIKTSWSEPIRLINKEDVEQLSFAIEKVLKNISSNEEVYFNIRSGHTFEGKTYLSEKGWYWYISAIDGRAPKKKSVGSVKEWKINVGKTDNYVITSSRYRYKNIRLNWIVKRLPEEVSSSIKLHAEPEDKKSIKLKFKDEYEEADNEDEALQENKKSNQHQGARNMKVIREKVLVLEGLRKDGFITDEEYKQKLSRLLGSE